MKQIVTFAFIYLGCGFFLHAQNVTLSGYTYNQKTNKPVPLVNVSIVGNQHLRDDQTDSEGFFTITLKSGIKEGGLVRMIATKEGFEKRDERVVVSSLKPIKLLLVPIAQSPPFGKTTSEKSPNDHAVSKLIKDLKDKSGDPKVDACYVLGDLGKPAKAATNTLIDLLLRDGYSRVRACAAWSLGQINRDAPEVKKSLYQALKDQHPDVRGEASKSLLRGMKSAGELEPVVSILINHDVDGDTKDFIMKLGTEVIPILNKALQSDPLNKIWVLDPLLHLNPDLKSELFPYLTKGLTFETNTINGYLFWQEVMNSFTHYHFNDSDAFPFLFEVILKDVGQTNHDDPVHSLGHPDDYPYFFEEDIKKPALQMLIDNNNTKPETIPLLIEIINKCSRQFYSIVLSRLLDSNIEPKNKVLAEALWNRHVKYQNFGLGMHHILELAFVRHKLDSTFLTEMVRWFNDLDTSVQLGIAEVLYRTDYPKEKVYILIEALKKGSTVQLMAVTSLGKIGSPAIDALPFLTELLNSTSNTRLKSEIARAIREIEDK